jgi:glutathionyl-hydroquinone reductase
MKGLEKVIGLSVTHPTWKRTRPDDESDTHHGWVFGENGQPQSSPNGSGSFVCDDLIPDTVNGCKFVRDLYNLAGQEGPTFSVPILWDKKLKTIVNNESSEIVQILNSAFNDFAENPSLDLAPAELKQSMEDVDSWAYEGINNGVYKCGFAKSQEAYDAASENLFTHLAKLESHLADKKFCCGDTFTLTDIRMFQTLIRFDEVYVVYFKCDKRKIAEHPNILRYCRDIWRIPGVKETTNMHHIKSHYFTSHTDLNKFAIIPTGPNFIGLLEQ